MIYEVLIGTALIAVCFDREAAEALKADIDAEYEADLADVEPVMLIDNYGFPFARKDIGKVWPGRYA